MVKERPCVSETEGAVVNKNVTRRDLEIWEVAKLDFNQEPRSKSSDLIEKVQERRRIRHEETLEKFYKSLQEVNDNVAKNIRISSMEVKAFMKNHNEQLEEMINSIDKPEVISYSGSVFLKFQTKADELKLDELTLINELFESLMTFENERAKKNKKIFQTYSEEIRKVGYLLPNDHQIFIEKEALKLNQISLNNRRCYEDLKLTLTLLTEKTYKTFVEKIFCVQEKWVEKRVQQVCSESQIKIIASMITQEPQAYRRLELKGQELVLELNPFEVYNTCEVENWAKNVDGVILTIEAYGKNIIELYKKALNAVYSGFDQDVEEIKKEMIKVEFLDIEERIIKPIVFEVQSEQAKQIVELESLWQHALDSIRKQLLDVTDFLLGAGKLWDTHSVRITEAKNLILKGIEKSAESNQAVLTELETKLNLSLDALRQEYNPTKIDKAYEAVVAVLNSIKEKYEYMYLNDVSAVEDFYKMTDLEANVLSAELEGFTQINHPIETSKNYNFCDQYRGLPEEPPLIRQIYMCIQDVNAVKYWKQGVWAALDNFAKNTRECLAPRAEAWVDKKIEFLAEKMTVQMEVLNKRFERIKVEIYEKRKSEVEYHRDILDQHIKGVKAIIKNLNKNLQILTKKLDNELMEIESKFPEIEEKAKTENRAAVVRGAQMWLERKKQDIEIKIKNSFEKFVAETENKVVDGKEANVAFIKDIKFFGEGGNFSAEEGKEYVDFLEGLDKDLTKEFSVVLKYSETQQNDLIQKNSIMFVTILKMLKVLHDELIFYQIVEAKVADFIKKAQEMAGTLKSDLELLKKQSECLKTFVETSEPFVHESDCIRWIVTIKTMYKNVCNLFYPIVYSENRVSNLSPERSLLEEMKGSKTSKRATDNVSALSKLSTAALPAKIAKAKLEEIFDCKDYRKQLFGSDSPPVNDETFMATISEILWNEMDSLQKIACTFYKNHRGTSIIREDLIPVNYEMFGEKLLTKFQYYSIQCEEFWLQKVTDFFPILGQIKESTNRLFQRWFNEYEEIAIDVLRNYEDDFFNCLDQLRVANSEKFQSLENKLLPLHGYPNNNHLLESVEEEVVKSTAAMAIRWEISIKSFQDQVKCFRVKHLKNREQLSIIEHEYLKIKKVLFIEELGNNLLNLITKVIEKGGYHLKREKLSVPELNRLKRSVEEDQTKLKLLKKNVRSVHSFLTQLKDIIDYERRNNETSMQDNLSPDTESHFSEAPSRFIVPKLNVLLDPLEIDKITAKIIERIGEQSKQMKNSADSKKNAYNDYLYKWLGLWKINVKKIQTLYSVRYKEKPKDTKEKEKPKDTKEKEKPKDTKEKEKPKDTKEKEKPKDTKEKEKETSQQSSKSLKLIIYSSVK